MCFGDKGRWVRDDIWTGWYAENINDIHPPPRERCKYYFQNPKKRGRESHRDDRKGRLNGSIMSPNRLIELRLSNVQYTMFINCCNLYEKRKRENKIQWVPVVTEKKGFL